MTLQMLFCHDCTAREALATVEYTFDVEVDQ